MTINRLFFLLLTLSAITTIGYAQSLSIGIRDNEYAFIKLQTKHHLFVAVDNSIKIEKPQTQQFNVYVGFRLYSLRQKFSFETSFRGSTTWNRNYGATSLITSFLYTPTKKTTFRAGIGGNYDTLLGTDFLWNGTIQWQLLKDIVLVTEATNYVIYRETEERVNIGIDINSCNLHVSPRFSFPINDNIRYTRVLISFLYDISL